MSELNYADTTTAGADYLDSISPGWHKKVNRSTIDMLSHNKCIAGQVFGSIAHLPAPGDTRDRVWCYTRGFFTNDGTWGRMFNYIDARRNLEREWAKRIQERLEADKKGESNVQASS